MSIIEVI